MNTQPDINPAQPMCRALAETELLIKYLENAEVGQVITYQELNAACKDDVQARNTILQTAKKTLLRNKRFVFGTIAGVGIKRLSDEEIPDEGISAVERSRRIAKNGHSKLLCADMANMTPETKVKAITTRTILGLFNGAGGRKVKLLAEQAARASDTLKIGDVASLFGK